MSQHHETERQQPSARPAGGSDPKGSQQTPATAGEQVKSELGRASAEVRDQGEEIASTAMEQADRYATEQKETGAQHVANFARAVDRAASELESSSPELARYAHKAASSVDTFSDTLRQSSVRELIDETTDFARREPAFFFGAAVMAGLTISRFLRSSEDHEAGRRHSGHGAASSGTTASGRHS